VSLHGIVESQFLLLEDSLLGAETLAVSGDSGEGVLLLDQLSLVGDPLLLHLSNLIFHIIDFLLNVILLGLEGTRILILSILLLKLIQLTVQSIHTVLLLGDCNMALLDVTLKLFYFTLFILKLVDQIIKLLLKQLILRLSIEVIDTHTRDFICYVFNLDFLLGYLLIRDFSLLNQVSTRLLNSFLLRRVIDYIITDPLCLCVQLHYRLLKNLHLLVDIHLFNVHALRLLFSGLERGLQHNVLLLQALLVGFDLIASLLVELLLRLAFLQFFM
jgi:hypothetical protein